MVARRGGSVNRKSESFVRRRGDLNKQITKLQKQIQRKLSEVDGASFETLDVVGKSILKRSNELAPKDTGALRKSGFVKTTTTRRAKGDIAARISRGFVTTVGYNADGSAPHAVYAHEIGPYKNPTTPGTQYKFLSTALVERLPMIVSILKAAITRALRKK